jgi:hypothetical protein
MFFAKDASSKNCNLYHLPIVGSQNELLTVVNKMTAGVPSKSKKAALVQIANKEAERTPVVNHVVSSREAQKPVHSSPDAVRQAQKKASFTITAAHVESSTQRATRSRRSTPTSLASSDLYKLARSFASSSRA